MNLYLVLDYRSSFDRVQFITDDLRHALLEMGEEKSEWRQFRRLIKVEGVELDPRLIPLPPPPS